MVRNGVTDFCLGVWVRFRLATGRDPANTMARPASIGGTANVHAGSSRSQSTPMATGVTNMATRLTKPWTA